MARRSPCYEKGECCTLRGGPERDDVTYLLGVLRLQPAAKLAYELAVFIGGASM